MADATNYTIELKNHSASTIKFTGDAVSVNGGYYYLNLVEGSLDVSTPNKKRVWAGENNVARMGAGLVSETYENREIAFSAIISSSDRDYIKKAFSHLHEFSYQAGFYGQSPPFVNGYWYFHLQWYGTDDSVHSYALIHAADVSAMPDLYSEAGLNFYSNGRYRVPVTITLYTEPAFRRVAPFSNGTQVITSQTVYPNPDDGNNYVQITGSSIVGDIPPLVQLNMTYTPESGQELISYSVRSRATVGNFVQHVEAETMGIFPRVTGQYAEPDGQPNAFGGDYSQRILNNSFETAGAGGSDVFASWTEATENGGSIERSSAQAYSGTYSAKITTGSPVTAGNYVSQTRTVDSSQTYRFTFWHRATTDLVDLFEMRYYVYDETNSNYLISLTYALSTDGGWRYNTRTFTTPSNCTSVTVGFVGPSYANQFAYVDLVTLAAVNCTLIGSENDANLPNMRIYKEFPLTDHMGTFRVIARCKAEDASDAGVRGQYILGGGLYAGAARSAYSYRNIDNRGYLHLDSDGTWEIIDLGRITVSVPRLQSTTSAYLTVIINTYAPGDTDFWIDYIEIIPLDDGYGWVRATQISDSSTIKIDERISGVTHVLSEEVSPGPTFEQRVVDYDVSGISLNPGITTRIYFNLADEDGALQNTDASAVVNVYLTERRMTIV